MFSDSAFPLPFPKGEGRLAGTNRSYITFNVISRFARIYFSSAIQKNLLLPPCASKMQSGSKTRFCSKDPCKCIEDARSLVLRLDLPSASQRNFNQLTNSCLAVEVPLRGTFVLLLCGPSGEDLQPSCMVFEQIASSKHFSVSDAIAEHTFALVGPNVRVTISS